MLKIILLILIFFPLNLSSQLLFPIVGYYKGKSAQGIVIFDDMAYVINDGGRCRALNLKTGRVEKEFMLGCAPLNPHVNSVCFGKEKAYNTEYPYLYVSETRGDFRCFVDKMTVNGTTHLQKISAKQRNKKIKVKTWIVDVKNDCLYGITRDYKTLNEKKEYRNTMYKFKLPHISDGSNIVLEDDDIYDSYDLYFASGIQGAKIKGKYMYIVTGREETAQSRIDAKRMIQVVDLEKRCIVKTIDLTYITVNEPEDIDFYHNNIYLFCGQNGGIYVVCN